MNQRLIFPSYILAIILAVAIALSAFGAHGLKAILSADRLESFQTATHYLLIQTALVFVLSEVWKHKMPFRGLNLVLIGTLAFSVSIFLLIWFKQMAWPYLFLVPITPIGGTLMIIGWLMVALALYKYERAKS